MGWLEWLHDAGLQELIHPQAAPQQTQICRTGASLFDIDHIVSKCTPAPIADPDVVFNKAVKDVTVCKPPPPPSRAHTLTHAHAHAYTVYLEASCPCM